MRDFVGVLIVLGIVFLVARFHERTYKPPSPRAAPGAGTRKDVLSPKLPLRCAVVISGADRGRGTEIVTVSGKAVTADGVNTERLLRPMGQMVADALPTRAEEVFAQVQLFDSDPPAADADVILRPCCWTFGDEVGGAFKGLPLLIAAGSAWAEVRLDLRVAVERAPVFTLSDSSGKVSVDFPLALFPYARSARTLTEATESAVAVACRKVVGRTAREPIVVAAANRRSGVKVP